MTIEVQVRGNNVEKAMRILKKKLMKEFDKDYYWNGRMFEAMKETYEER